MTTAIELESERLLLRQWRETDADDYFAICHDANVMKYLTGKPFTRLESWRHLAYLAGHWQLRGFGHWAVELKSSGRLIGRVGFIEPDGWPGFEIGWTLAHDCWGKGYATEGAKAALNYAFDSLAKTEVISIIHPQNTASMKVAERLGDRKSVV